MNFNKWQRVVVIIGMIALIILAINPPQITSMLHGGRGFMPSLQSHTNGSALFVDFLIIISCTAAIVGLTKERKP